MAISTKRRRRITVGGERYLWWAAQDKEGLMTLEVISPDQQFHASYLIFQEEGQEYLGMRVAGPRQAGAGIWGYFRCPRFCSADRLPAVTPAHLRSLIEWCLDPDITREWADGNGRPHGSFLRKSHCNVPRALR